MFLVNYFVKWLSSTKIWVWASKNIIAKYTTRVKGYPQFPMEKYDDVLSAIARDKNKNGPGVYAFVCTDRESFAGRLVSSGAGGFWTHAGFVVGKNVLEMKAKGMVHRHLLYILRENDYFALGRIEMTPEGNSQVLRELRELIQNTEAYSYDFKMYLGGNEIYCSELPYEKCNKYALNPNFKPHEEYGRMVFEPDDLYNSMKILFEYKGE